MRDEAKSTGAFFSYLYTIGENYAAVRHVRTAGVPANAWWRVFMRIHVEER